MGNPGGNVVYMDRYELWDGYAGRLLDLAKREGVTAVAELGGGANPLVADSEKWGFAKERVVIDISADELAKGDGEVEKRVADLCEPIEDGLNRYDLVFSQMLCEHIPDPAAFHANCFKLLRPGGLAVHFFPTLQTTPIAVNWLIPEQQARSLLNVIQPSRIDDPKQQKFPAHYRWCLGPSRRTTRRFESVGFVVERTEATFGHEYYRRIPPLYALERLKTKFLFRHPVPRLASYVVVILRKPAIGHTAGEVALSARVDDKALRNASG